MPNFKLIVSSNLPQNLALEEWLGCADVSHNEEDKYLPSYKCRRKDKFLIFQEQDGVAMFVHAGCERINLGMRETLNAHDIAVLRGVATGLSMRCKVDGDGFMRLVESTMEEIAEYRRMEKLVALAVSGRSNSVPPPPHHPCESTTPTGTPILLESKEDFQRMDDFLSGSKYAQYGRTYKSISERNTPPEILEASLKRPELPSSREPKNRKMEARKAAQAFSAFPSQLAKDDDHKPTTSDPTRAEISVDSSPQTINLNALPDHVRLIDLKDKPNLRSYVQHLPCEDISHNEIDWRCSHAAKRLLVNTMEHTATIFHEDTEMLVKAPRRKLSPSHIGKVTRMLEAYDSKRNKTSPSTEGDQVAEPPGGKRTTTAAEQKVGDDNGMENNTMNDKPKTTLPIPIRSKAPGTFPSRQRKGPPTAGKGFLALYAKADAEVAAYMKDAVAKLPASLTIHDDETTLPPTTATPSTYLASKTSKRSKTTVSLVGWEQQGAKIRDGTDSKDQVTTGGLVTPKIEVTKEGEGGRSLIAQRLQENFKNNDSLKAIPGVMVNHEGGKNAQSKPSQEKKSKTNKRVVQTPGSTSEPRAAAPGVSVVVVKDEDDDWEAVDKDEAEDEEYVFI